MKKLCAWALAFLLTGSLILFGVTFVFREEIVPALAENGAPVNEGLLRQEKELIRKRILELSALYGFSPEPVLEAVNDKTLETLSQDASAWWNSVLRYGKAGDPLTWDTEELESILFLDDGIADRQNEEGTVYMAEAAAAAVRESVLRVILPLRQKVIQLALQRVGRRIDLTNLLSFFLGIPWMALALSALLAGLIALLESRRLSGCLTYFGAAMGAAALVLLVLMVLFGAAGIEPMLREASESMSVQYRSESTAILLQEGVLCLVLLSGCAVCLDPKRKNA